MVNLAAVTFFIIPVFTESASFPGNGVPWIIDTRRSPAGERASKRGGKGERCLTNTRTEVNIIKVQGLSDERSIPGNP